jgi:hypothetical protein
MARLLSFPQVKASACRCCYDDAVFQRTVMLVRIPRFVALFGRSHGVNMILTLENLHAGISWWDARWDLDLMNADYFAIYEARANGLTESWWSTTVATLSRWQAYRGPKPPNRKEEITKRGLDELTHLASEYSKLVEGSRSEPCIADLHWEEVEPMFTIAFGIKHS